MTTQNIDISSEILEWSQERSGWQRDALRRLFLNGKVNPDEIGDLVELCKAAKGLSAPRAPEILATEHLAIKDGVSEAVSLVSLIHHHGANALAPEQTVSFSPNLTIVYGKNAAGKSGYARILKRACRSRSAEEILGNVLSGETPTKLQATIKFRHGPQTTPVVEWKADAPPSAALAAVSVFDAGSAPVYLKDKTDVAFRPFGLDIFDQLSTICGEVRSRLETEKERLSAVVSAGAKIPIVPFEFSPPLDVVNRSPLHTEEVPKLVKGERRARTERTATARNEYPGDQRADRLGPQDDSQVCASGRGGAGVRPTSSAAEQARCF